MPGVGVSLARRSLGGGGRLIVVVLAAAIGAIPVAPPEHVHEVEEHGQHHAVVHRHAAVHTGTHHDADHDGVLDDDDGSIRTLEPIYTVPTVVALAGVSATLATRIDQPAYTFAVKTEYVERLIHGPPRAPTGLRAPPLPSRL
jgi:hypothetical protein